MAAVVVADLGAPSWIVLMLVITAECVAVLLVARHAYGRVALWQSSTIVVGYFWLTYVARPTQLLWRGGSATAHESGSVVLPHGGRVLEAAALQLLCALVAYRAAVRCESLNPVMPTWTPSRRRLAVAAAATLALLGIGLLAVIEGGIGTVFTSAFRRRELFAGRFYISALVYFGPAMLVFVVYEAARGRVRLQTAAAIGVLAAFVMIPLGQRGEFILLGVSSLAAWQAAGRRVRLTFIPLAMAAVAIVITGGLGLRQSQSSDPTVGRSTLSRLSLDPRAAAAAAVEDGFTNFDRAAYAMPKIPSVVPYEGLSAYARLLAAPIPRGIWPGKPGLTEANATAGIFGSTTGAFTLGPVGGAWLQAGWLGVLFAGIVGGILWAATGHLVAAARTITGRLVGITASLQLLFGASNLDIVYVSFRVLPVVVIGLILQGARGQRDEPSPAESVRGLRVA